MKTILVADDEAKLRKLVAINLKSWGYNVLAAADGAHALQLLSSEQVDLVLLDIMMPQLDGLSVLRTIRESSTLPVIILTAKDSLNDKVLGFNLGADDYLQKPFALEELSARVKAVLRRTETPLEHEMEALEFKNGPMRALIRERRVWVNDVEVRLSSLEFKLLIYFLKHINCVLTHEQIMTHLWGEDGQAELQYLRVLLARLRAKLRDAGLCKECGIVNYSGIGYLMEGAPTRLNRGASAT